MQPKRENGHKMSHYARRLQNISTMTERYDATNIQSWINAKMLRGFYSFSKADLISIGLSISESSISRNLNRLEHNGMIMSPWQNFYVIIPTEYKLRGLVPPIFYIDKLMQFLNREYYISLLTAAELNGASHQRSMVFQVTMNGRSVRSGVKNGTRIEFFTRQDLPLQFTTKMKTKSGYVTVSRPELTALDLVADYNKVGGLSRAAEILSELSEQTEWDNNKLPLLTYFKLPTIQRLGYILDLLEFSNQSDALYSLMLQMNKTTRRTPLKVEQNVSDDMSSDNRWKIIENYKLEIDDI